jgi:ABC-type uncharacterized transport system fused permease/ATPase subunit
VLRREDVFRLLVSQQLQEPLASGFVVVRLRVEQSSFNWMTDSYGRISDWAASANRVASLLLALDQIDGQTSPGAVAGADFNEFAERAGTLTSD